MDKWTGRVALVTGASVGIGAAIATRLVEHGLKVVGCARNVQKIEALAESLKGSKGSLTAIQCDVSKEDQILSMFEQIKKQYGGVDICINNAGLAHNAPLLTGSTEMWKQMYDVLTSPAFLEITDFYHGSTRWTGSGPRFTNELTQEVFVDLNINVIGLMICSREAIKSMEERKVDDGFVFLISSMSGHRVVNNPATHVYASTKFAVKAITEGMRNELCAKGSHIRVTSISPGVVETEFAPRLNADNPEKGRQLYRDVEIKNFCRTSNVNLKQGKMIVTVKDHHIWSIQHPKVAVISGTNSIQPQEIADAVVYSMSAPTRTQIHDILIRPTTLAW